MFCNQCGQQSAPGSAFCSGCGGPLAAHANVQPMTPSGNGMAVASMVLGICGLVVSWFILAVPSILAVVFGHIGHSQSKQRNGVGHGMAIAGLVMGYITIGLYVILITIGLSMMGAH